MTPGDKCGIAQALLIEARDALQVTLAETRDRSRGALNQELWTVVRMLGEVPEYFSQAGQDHFVDRCVSTGLRDGVFVDVGGYDGITGSNTLFFELFRGWTGLLIEPVPQHLAAASARRRCRCIGTAVAGRDGSREFLQVADGYTQMSGLADRYDPGMLQAVRDNPQHREQVVTIEAQSLARLLRDAGLQRVDYLSLDVEGAEEEILDAFPFDDFDVAAWSIENADGKPGIERRMQAAGYQLVEYIGVDEIYVRRH